MFLSNVSLKFILVYKLWKHHKKLKIDTEYCSIFVYALSSKIVNAPSVTLPSLNHDNSVKIWDKNLLLKSSKIWICPFYGLILLSKKFRKNLIISSFLKLDFKFTVNI